MRVAVSALEPRLDGAVDEQFGRAAYLLFVDSETMAFELLDNTANRNALQGAGIATAELVAERRVEAVLTGHLGPKAFQALEVASIPAYAATGMRVRDAVTTFVAGGLRRLIAADALGRSGVPT
jgi:predicted Fe-Mo cluster-binding NifX family protein